MSIVVKAGAGLAAGVVAGALGLAFLPHEPSAVRPRNAVEKPQFVVAATPLAASPQPSATLAVAMETPAAKAPQPLANPPVANVVAASASPAPVKSAEASLAPEVVAKVASSPPVSVPSAVAPSATPLEGARWSVRGLVALARGDISSARLFLARAAEAGDARAWVALADTYDPAMLAKLGVIFAPGDAQRAKDCLVKAVAAGVVVPKDRLAALEQGDHPVR